MSNDKGNKRKWQPHKQGQINWQEKRDKKR
jgi:hypothetical protein